jgi:hypothetical protein
VKRPPKTVYVLFDKDGEECGIFMSQSDADCDALGPRFRPYRVRRYTLKTAAVRGTDLEKSGLKNPSSAKKPKSKSSGTRGR